MKKLKIWYIFSYTICLNKTGLPSTINGCCMYIYIFDVTCLSLFFIHSGTFAFIHYFLFQKFIHFIIPFIHFYTCVVVFFVRSCCFGFFYSFISSAVLVFSQSPFINMIKSTVRLKIKTKHKICTINIS